MFAERIVIVSSNEEKIKAVNLEFGESEVVSAVPNRKTVDQPCRPFIYRVAMERIANLIVARPEMVQPDTLFVALENGIDEDRLCDVCCAVAYHCEMKRWFRAEASHVVPIHEGMFQKYVKSDGVTRVDQGYSGKTFGQFFAEIVPGVNHQDWMGGYGMKRHVMFAHALNNLILNVGDVYRHVKVYPDDPIPGVNFLDWMPVLACPKVIRKFIDMVYSNYLNSKNFILSVGVEARGFALAGAFAQKADCGYVPCRKPGKLKGEVYAVEYQKEYGTDRLEIQKDDLSHFDKVVIFDDIMATGGTIIAVIDLLQKCGVKRENMIVFCLAEAMIPGEMGVERIMRARRVPVHVLY